MFQVAFPCAGRSLAKFDRYPDDIVESLVQEREHYLRHLEVRRDKGKQAAENIRMHEAVGDVGIFDPDF